MNHADGYFDLQVNGYAGIDFQDDALTDEQLHRACAALRADGVAAILATIITEHIPVMERRLRRLVELRQRDPLARELIAGIHIEGPFISPVDGYRGAHPRDAVRPADRDAMRRLLDAAGGLARLVTLAPENDPNLSVTRMLACADIRVSAGHTDASLDQLNAAIDAGLSMFTHLGNGCPMQMHRHDNIIQRALSLSDKLWLMFIADGAHIPFHALSNYLRLAGMERSIVVTDAVAPAGMGAGRFRLGRWDLLIGEDLVARAPDGSHLIGSALSLPQAVHRLIEHAGLTPRQAKQLTVDNPARAMTDDAGTRPEVEVRLQPKAIPTSRASTNVNSYNII
jgi:N-acetylglucosamine-6-phosphate deacetylase